jgi:3-hydroxypropanoate dehydrogenase
MSQTQESVKVSLEAIHQLFSEARTHHAWLPKKVEDGTLQALYEIMKWGPTSANTNPVRIVFVKSEKAKAQLIPCLMPGNVDQTKAAPVTAIVAWDERFYDLVPRLFPVAPQMKDMFASNKPLAERSAFQNSTLQGGYLIVAARAVGLDCGPMAGFDNAKVDEAFFKGTTWKSNFLCNLGYGDASKLYPRGPRLSFDEACKII